MSSKAGLGAKTTAPVPPPSISYAVAALLQRKCACGSVAQKGGECEECKKDGGTLRRKPDGSNRIMAAPPIVHQALRGPGHELDARTLEFFETRFGHDFGNVRVHTDELAAESARAVHAQAYTVGRDIVFGANLYSPTRWDSRRLLAHELAHIVQQRHSAGSVTATLEINERGDTFEREADHAAEWVMQSPLRQGVRTTWAPDRAGTATRRVQRQSLPPLPQDDPTRFQKLHETLFGPNSSATATTGTTAGTATIGAASTPAWDATAKSTVISQFTKHLSDEQAKHPDFFDPSNTVPERTTQSDAETDAVAMDQQLRQHFSILPAALPKTAFLARIKVITTAEATSDAFLKQWMTPRILTHTDASKYGLKRGDANFDKLLDEILADSLLLRKMRAFAPHTFGGYTIDSGGTAPEIRINQGVPTDARKPVLLHELVHFYAHKTFVDWVTSTLHPTEYSEGFSEYLARRAMTAEQLAANGAAYDAFVKMVRDDVALYVPDDDIARAYFLGEVWRIEGKSRTSAEAFKQQVGLEATATHKQEQKESLAGPGINETVVEGARYRFMNLADEHPEPKPEHVAFFQEIYTKYVAGDPTAHIRFVGHASSPGTDAFNDELSKRRSAAFYRMARSAGVPPDQLIDADRPPHEGSTKPTAENETVRGRAFNRRVEMYITHFSLPNVTPTSPQRQQKVPAETSTEGTEGTLQRKLAGPAGTSVAPPIVHEVLRSPGQPLDATSRAFFEPRFGHDFSNVRVHTDARGAESARAVNAAAYTVGRELVFAPGKYSPHTEVGRQLLAHELTHVVQQCGAQPQPQLEIGRSGDLYEQQADRVAIRVMRPVSGPDGSISESSVLGQNISPLRLASSAEATLQRRVLSGIAGIDEDWEVMTSAVRVARQTDPTQQPSFEEQAEAITGREKEVAWSKQSPGLTEQPAPGQRFLLMNFAINSPALKPEHQQFLIDILLYRTLTADPMATVRIIGHSDATGPKQFNEKLALRRARTVEAQLKASIREGGIESVTGKGSLEPIADNGTVLGRAKNRRVEIQVVPWKPAKPVPELIKEAAAGQKPFIYRVDNFAACPFQDTVKQIVESAFRPIGIIQFDWDGKAASPDAVLSFDTTTSFPMALGLTGTIYMRSFRENEICKDDSNPKTCEKAFPETADMMGKAIGNTLAHEAGHLLSLDHVTMRDNFMWSADLESLHGKKNKTYDERVAMRRTYHLLQVHFNDSQLVRMATRIAEKRKFAKTHPHEIEFQ